MVIVGLAASKDTGSYNNEVKRSKTSYIWRLELQRCGGGGDGDAGGGDEDGGDINKGKQKVVAFVCYDCEGPNKMVVFQDD